MRAAVAGAVVAALAAQGAAGAAPRKVCRLLGPSTGATVAGPNAALDIASADVASNAKTLTAVIRMRTLDDPQAAVSGRTFLFYFSRSVEESYALAGTLWGSTPGRFALGAMSEPFHPQANEATIVDATWFAPVTATVDRRAKEVRMSVPLSAFRTRPASSVRNGATVTYLGAEVARTYGTNRDALPAAPPEGVPTDVGTGGRWTYTGTKVTYRLGTPSCLRP
ncbi:MAG TPA: hypothetical protein VNA20_01025 [Frankiaceae bacterium]|nr:hypothetical protein [Frankiaceae bacterium]